MSDIEAIRQRCEAATKGDWFVWFSQESGKWTVQIASGWLFVQSAKGTHADAEFIAHARTDIPTLLAALDAVTGERDALRSNPAMEWDSEGIISGLQGELARAKKEIGALHESINGASKGIANLQQERDAALHSRDEYLKLWQQVTAGLLDVQEENKRLRAALEALLAVSTGQHTTGPQHLEARRKAIDQARAALAARGGGDEASHD